MTIVEFLNARLDEEDRLSDEVPTADEPVDVHDPAHGMWVYDDDYRHDSIVIDEVRLKREIAAKRAILDSTVGELERYGNMPPEAHIMASEVIKAMAAVYSDHPDYEEALAS